MTNSSAAQAMAAEFRSRPWIRIFLGLVVLLLAGAVFALWRTQGPGVLGWTFLALFLFSLLGFADSLLARVRLSESELTVVSNLRRRSFQRADFQRVTWARGSGVALQRTNGSWLAMPDVVMGGPGLANALRAWLKHGSA